MNGVVVSEASNATEPVVRQTDGAEKRMPVLLLLRDAAARVERVVRIQQALSIGRGTPTDDPSQLLIPDPLLSRAHLRIVPKPGGCDAEDLGSLNGTFVDGRRIDAPVRLSDGTILFFGAQAAVFRRVSTDALLALEQEGERPFGPEPTSSPDLAVTSVILRRLAPTDAEILLQGETGVGKEVYARAIHAASGRKGPFVALNCAAIPQDLVESELFGYERGAHSTASAAKPGLIRMADGGTLFLDEIGEMDARIGGKLLRFLQDKEVMPLGGTRSFHVDARIIAATSRMPASGGGPALRSDLLGRLGAEPVTIPPLRDRIEDVSTLIGHFTRAEAKLDVDAFRSICLYAWPRNVRELEKVMTRALALAVSGTIRLADLPAALRETLARGPTITVRRRPRAAPSRAELQRLLIEHDGNVTAVARTLDRQWNVVWRWLQKYGLQARGGSPGDEPIADDDPPDEPPVDDDDAVEAEPWPKKTEKS